MAPSADISGPSTPKPKAASRLLHSVKRTLSPSSAPRKRPPDYICEDPRAPQQFRDPDPASLRPTIEQIAMGLHLSRTPHLRPLASSPYAFSQRNSLPHSGDHREHHHHHRATPIVLPPPPPRSSLKRPPDTLTSSSSSPAVSPPFSSASATSTTVSVTQPSTQGSGSFAAIKFRMARFLPHNRSASAPSSLGQSPMSSPRSSTSNFPPQKKAVRFTTDEAAEGD